MKLLATVAFLCALAHASTSTLTGKITDAQGTGVNGTLIMTLPVPASDGSTAISPGPVVFRLVNGTITGGAPLYDVGSLQPSNLYYIARAYDSMGYLQFYGNFAVTGGTYNLGAATPTSITTSNISYSTPAFVNGNNTWTGTNIFTGASTFTATSTFTAPLNVTNAGVFTNTQQNTYFSSAIGGINASTWYSTVQNGNFSTDAAAGGVLVPLGSTVHQINGLAGYILSHCNSVARGVCNGVGVYGQAIDSASDSGAGIWGGNLVCQSSGTNTNCTGLEIDMNTLAGANPTYFVGLVLNGAGTGTIPPAYSPGANPAGGGAAAIQVVAPYFLGASNYRWPLGLVFSRGSVNGTAVQIDAPCIAAGVPCASDPITFTGYDAGNVGRTSSISGSAAGDINLTPVAGRSTIGANIPIVTAFTTTAAATDNVTVTGMTSSGHCSLTATNSGGAGGIASVFVSAKTTNQITVTHTATSGWTFDVMCTPN